MNKKMIPNIITLLRVVGAVLLFFVEPLGLAFYIIYSFCGVTDAVDGFIARKLDATSELGSILDSISDLLFYVAMLIKLTPILIGILDNWIWYFVFAVIAVRLCSYVVSAIKNKKFASIHTFLNKATGFLVFAVPYLLFLPTNIFKIYAVFVCCVGMIASAQELIFHIKTKTE